VGGGTNSVDAEGWEGAEYSSTVDEIPRDTDAAAFGFWIVGSSEFRNPSEGIGEGRGKSEAE